MSINWINGFELICYVITVIFLVDVIRKKSRDEFWLFISAAFAGFALELLAVRVTGIYHYSKDYFISIGFEPYQFPFFGGLMWGGLTVYALRLAKKLKLSPLMTALVGGWLIVTMDIFLDVAAIRLNGGFWVWEGREITLEITHHMFMSVIWVNFLGYMFETPAILYISQRTSEKRSVMPVWKQLLASLGIGAAGIAFVGAASGISLALNSVTDEWFACIAFLIIWIIVLIVILRAAFRGGFRLNRPQKIDIPVIIYWAAMCGFCIAALIYLGIAAAAPWYFAACVVFAAGTILLSCSKKKHKN